jgi:hypothetical protein
MMVVAIYEGGLILLRINGGLWPPVEPPELLEAAAAAMAVSVFCFFLSGAAAASRDRSPTERLRRPSRGEELDILTGLSFFLFSFVVHSSSLSVVSESVSVCCAVDVVCLDTVAGG